MLYSEMVTRVNNDSELCQQLRTLYESYVLNGMALSTEVVENLNPLIWQPLNLVAYGAAESSWFIQPQELFAYYVLTAKVPEFIRSLPLDLAELRLMHRQATEPFSADSMPLRKRVLELILKNVHEQTGSDFREWIKQCTDESNQWIKFEFLEAYCAIADDLPLPGQSIADASRQFLSWRDGMAEIHVNELLTRYATNNHKAATYLLRSLLESNDQSIQSGLLGGLLVGDAERCWPMIEELYSVSRYQAFIMKALPRLPLPDSATGWRILNLLLSYDRTVEANRMIMPYSLTQIVDKAGFNDANFIKCCYNELDELAHVEHQQTAQSVLSALRLSVRKCPIPSVSILLALLANPTLQHEHIGKLNYHPNFDDVLHHVNDIDLIFEFFEEYARRYAVQFKHDTFYLTIHGSYIRDSTTSAFRNRVLDCLIHDEGKIRVFGCQILSFFSHYGYQFEFHTDIVELTPIVQYKLWLSVLSFSLRPGHTIPLVLPLLLSEEPIVAEALLCKLEELTESYHNEIIRLVEEYASQQGPLKTRVKTALTRLKLYYSEFCRQLNEKGNISEFRPSVCQTAIFSRFNQIQRHKMNERMNTVMEESGGLISLFKKVTLAKGGGWKHNRHEEISKLGHIQSSFTWPRLHLVNPEMFDLEHRINRAENWLSNKTDFFEWIIE